tara:strand:+ start:11910 stop:12077 length:168 start_codon:yes stop_codon:yes gene_type:complete
LLAEIYLRVFFYPIFSFGQTNQKTMDGFLKAETNLKKKLALTEGNNKQQGKFYWK